MRLVLKEFKSKADVLLEDVSSCIDETNSRCKQQVGDVQNDSDRILTEVGKLMKELFENTQDLARLLQRTEHFHKIVNDKTMEEQNCDLKSLLTLELARLLHQERVVTLPQAIRSSNLIDFLFPPVQNAKFEPITLDIKPQPQSDNVPCITGCTILRTGVIVLVDKANKSLKLLKDNGILKEIKFQPEPFDITEKEGNLCVTFPTNCKIYLIMDPEGKDTEKAVISTETNCYGIEYGGGKIVVACQVPKIWTWVPQIWPWSRPWLFRVYGSKYNILQVFEKDRFGHPFHLTDGYFDFCPLRDEILFLKNDRTATRFYLTGPSQLESLGEMGPKNGETLTAIRSSGNMKITCHTEKNSSINPFSSRKSTLRLYGSLSSPVCEIIFGGKCVGPFYFDVRSRKLIVCEKENSKTFYLYNIKTLTGS